MSTTHMTAAWLIGGDFGPSQRIVLLCLADHAGYDGRVSMSATQIGDCCGLSPRSVPRIVASLVDAELVSIIDNGVGRGFAPIYRITINARQVTVPGGKPRSDGVFSDGVDTGEPENTTDTAVFYASPQRASEKTPQVLGYLSNIGIPAGSQVEPEGLPAGDLNAVAGASVEDQGPDGAEGPPNPPDEAPAPPVARGGAPQPSSADLPPHLPKNLVGLVLHAAGVERNESAPLLWFRSEHAAALADLLLRINIGPEEAAARIRSIGRKVPDLARIADLEQLILG